MSGATIMAPPLVKCVGAIHGPPGDCSVPITGALVCYGYLDEDESRPMRESLEGPLPLLFGACDDHRSALVEWAEYLWGEIADAIWIPPHAIPRALQLLGDPDPIRVSPDPADAVRVVA